MLNWRNELATIEDKIQRIKAKIEGRTGLSNLVPGTKAYQLIESVAYEQMEEEFTIEESDRKKSILKARSQELDAIGSEFFGISRLPEIPPFISSSMKCIKFYVNTGSFGDINSGQDISINEGVTIAGVFAGAYYRFRVITSAVLLKDEREKYIDAELIQGSMDSIPSGILNTHDFSNYSGSSNNLLKVTNVTPVSTGRDRESDENYRFRIINQPKSIPQTTSPAFRKLATEIPGVSDVFIEQSSNGGGTFTVYVQGITPITGDEIIQRVKDAAAMYLSPWVINYTIKAPNYIGVSYDITVKAKDGLSDAQERSIKDIISSHINNTYGSLFYLNSIISLVLRSDPNLISVTINSCSVYTGEENLRTYYDVDFTNNSNPVIYASSYEKFITEPISSSIMIRR